MGLFLQDHINNLENVLLAQAQVAGGAGHPVNKGTPRENFLKTFLAHHLSERVAIGQGEIFSAQSLSGESRNQIDVVIYRRNFPRIHLDEGLSGFFAESVVATIEVKSGLTKDELARAVAAARHVKQFPQAKYTVWSSGYQPPSILSYVVAYDGPAQMRTVASWLDQIHQEQHLSYPALSELHHTNAISPSLDGIFVLGKGIVLFGNSPWELNQVTAWRMEHPEIVWHYGQAERGSLYVLFLLLTTTINSMADTYLKIDEFLAPMSFSKIGAITVTPPLQGSSSEIGEARELQPATALDEVEKMERGE